MISQVFGWLEGLSKAHQFTFQALSAIGTAAAVIASLVIAIAGARANRPKLRAHVSITTILGGGIDQNDPPRFLCVDITNIGHVPFWLDFSFYNWRVPLAREYGTVNPLDGYPILPGVPGQREPVRFPTEVVPGLSRRIHLSTLEVFQQSNREQFERLNFGRKWRFLRLRAIIVTSDGRLFRARLAKGVKDEIRKTTEA